MCMCNDESEALSRRAWSLCRLTCYALFRGAFGRDWRDRPVLHHNSRANGNRS
jgi:hypothetical protein